MAGLIAYGNSVSGIWGLMRESCNEQSHSAVKLKLPRQRGIALQLTWRYDMHFIGRVSG